MKLSPSTTIGMKLMACTTRAKASATEGSTANNIKAALQNNSKFPTKPGGPGTIIPMQVIPITVSDAKKDSFIEKASNTK